MSEISQYTESLHEECGVFGMYDKTGKTDMVSAVYSALYALQHRGQESCGIALNVDGVLSGYRDLGLVSEVFTKRVLEELPRGAKMATGHVRYATAGQRSRSNAQPMVLHHCKGAMAVCHNGNLVNAPKLRRKLEMSGSIFHGTSDTEVIAYLLTQNRLLTPNIEMAVSRTMDDIEGAYSLVIMTHTKLIAARDPNGFRPLCIGELPDGNGYECAAFSGVRVFAKVYTAASTHCRTSDDAATGHDQCTAGNKHTAAVTLITATACNNSTGDNFRATVVQFPHVNVPGLIFTVRVKFVLCGCVPVLNRQIAVRLHLDYAVAAGHLQYTTVQIQCHSTVDRQCRADIDIPL